MSEETLRTREQQPEAFTWDLTSLYADADQWQAEYDKAEAMVADLTSYKGTLDQGGAHLVTVIEAIQAACLVVERLYAYAHLTYDQDSTNSAAQVLNARAMQLYSKLAEAIAFFDPELLSLPSETLEAYFQETPELDFYRQYLDDITRGRAHTLSASDETLLAQLGEIFSSSYSTFSLLDNADFVFPTIEGPGGQAVQLTHGTYGRLLESTDRRVRRDTFQQYYTVYNQFKNTLANVLSTNIKTDNYKAKVRHYPSARAAALFRNNVPESVYDTLLETVGDHLGLLHRYTALRKDLLGLDSLEMYDLYTPLLGDAPIKFSQAEARDIVMEALAPMGPDYLEIMAKAFDERWIDWYENKGKRSGAYSGGMYDSKPYVLLNWQDNINWLFTLVHELGHSAHSYLSRTNQPYVYSDYSIFLAEIASTTNENLLTDYLLKKYQDPQIRLYVLNHFLDGVKGTVFRQTQFAEFEHFMHQADAEGTPLTHEFLTENYRELNAKYYGPSVNSDSEIGLEWARIPHFYYNYYVFQYATGFSAATFFADKIAAGDSALLEAYKGFLKSGCSLYPIDTMKKAGLDMTQRDYIEATLKVFEARLNEFEALLAETK